jgi:prepilin-type N-terminal cleavage/methylation domain-containing protein
MKQINNRKGFTLIELLVVIAIIGILSTLAIVALGSARAKSRDAKRVSDMRSLFSALELYYNDNSMYPTNITPGQPLAYNGTTYMALVPSNPTPVNDGTNMCPAAGTMTNYPYSATTGGASYTITYCIGQSTGELGAGTHRVTPVGIN